MNAEEFITQFGAKGFPLGVDESLKETWELYPNSKDDKEPRLRILAVLGFWHLVRQAGMRRYLKMKPSDPAVIQKELRKAEFAETAKDIARQMVRYRLFDVLRVFKSRFKLVTPIRGDKRTLRLDLCLVPKKSEHMDSCLAKLSGMLYNGDLPRQLQEAWKKLPVKSSAKPKSALPKYNVRMASDSTLGFLPLYSGKNTSIHAVRTAGDTLVLRITSTVEADTVPWMSARKQDEMLKQLFTSAFSKLKG